VPRQSLARIPCGDALELQRIAQRFLGLSYGPVRLTILPVAGDIRVRERDPLRPPGTLWGAWLFRRKAGRR
jgi:hypothetical protein